jgi:hypothetical protein
LTSLKDLPLHRLREIVRAQPDRVLTYFGSRCGVVQLCSRPNGEVEHTRLLEYGHLVAELTEPSKAQSPGFCTWCARPLREDASTAPTATGRRHAFVFIKQDVETGRRQPICLDLTTEDFASEETLKAARRRAAVVRRESAIRFIPGGITI